MPSIRECVVVVALTAVVAAACDRAPTELAPGEIDALLAESGIRNSGPGSSESALPRLFRESVATVAKASGRAGAAALLADWHELQEELKAEAGTAERSAIETRLAAIHAEELRIVHTVLGNAVITRLVTQTNAGLAAASITIDAAANDGRDVTRAASMARQVREKLAAVTNALTVRAHREALDRAAEAAGLLSGLRNHLIELQRVEGIEILFPRAIGIVKRERGDPAAARLTEQLEQLNARTRAALRAGDREAAHQTLALARAEQIRIVQAVLGQAAAPRLVAAAANRALEIEAALDRLEAAQHDVVRHRRMLREAVDLHRRASAALAKDDDATALDLGSHAAGLLNTLQHLTWH